MRSDSSLQFSNNDEEENIYQCSEMNDEIKYTD